jgi:hypothetical protein
VEVCDKIATFTTDVGGDDDDRNYRDDVDGT